MMKIKPDPYLVYIKSAIIGNRKTEYPEAGCRWQNF